MDTTPVSLALSFPGGWEWIVILVIGVLLFGKRLPDVGRSLGRGIVEFKKGIKGIEEDVEAQSSQQRAATATPPALDEQRTVPRATTTPAETFAEPGKA